MFCGDGNMSLKGTRFDPMTGKKFREYSKVYEQHKHEYESDKYGYPFYQANIIHEYLYNKIRRGEKLTGDEKVAMDMYKKIYDCLKKAFEFENLLESHTYSKYWEDDIRDIAPQYIVSHPGEYDKRKREIAVKAIECEDKMNIQYDLARKMNKKLVEYACKSKIISPTMCNKLTSKRSFNTLYGDIIMQHGSFMGGPEEWWLPEHNNNGKPQFRKNKPKAKPKAKSTFRSGHAQAKQIISNMNRISDKTNKKFK